MAIVRLSFKQGITTESCKVADSFVCVHALGGETDFVGWAAVAALEGLLVSRMVITADPCPRTEDFRSHRIQGLS